MTSGRAVAIEVVCGRGRPLDHVGDTVTVDIGDDRGHLRPTHVGSTVTVDVDDLCLDDDFDLTGISGFAHPAE